MPEGWRTTTVGEFSPFEYGKALPAPVRDGGRYPVVGSGGVAGGHSEALVTGPVIVIGRKGTIGSVQLFDDGAYPIDTTFFVRPAAHRDTKFTYYLLRHLGLELLNSDSAVPGLNRGRAHGLAVTVPPLAGQREIAGVLGALDDLIDTNQRLIARLEALGEGLVRSTAGGSLGAIAEKLEAGWLLTDIGDACAVVESGRRPRGGVSGILSGVPSFGAESVDGLASFDYSKVKYVPDDFAASMRNGVVQSRDVLVYKDGGKPGDFRPKVGLLGDGFPYDEMVINEHVYRVRGSARVSQEFLYFWLRQPELYEAMKLRGTGAAIPGMNSTAFKSVPVAVPPLPVRESLFPVLEVIVGQALACALESRQLAEARDELLPLLLSGRVLPGEVAG